MAVKNALTHTTLTGTGSHMQTHRIPSDPRSAAALADYDLPRSTCEVLLEAPPARLRAAQTSLPN